MNAVITRTEPITAPAMTGALLACLFGDDNAGIVNLSAHKLPMLLGGGEEEGITVALR